MYYSYLLVPSDLQCSLTLRSLHSEHFETWARQSVAWTSVCNTRVPPNLLWSRKLAAKQLVLSFAGVCFPLGILGAIGGSKSSLVLSTISRNFTALYTLRSCHVAWSTSAWTLVSWFFQQTSEQEAAAVAKRIESRLHPFQHICCEWALHIVIELIEHIFVSVRTLQHWIHLVLILDDPYLIAADSELWPLFVSWCMRAMTFKCVTSPKHFQVQGCGERQKILIHGCSGPLGNKTVSLVVLFC